MVEIGKPIDAAEKFSALPSFSLLSRGLYRFLLFFFILGSHITELPTNVHILDLKSTNTSNPAEFILRYVLRI